MPLSRTGWLRAVSVKINVNSYQEDTGYGRIALATLHPT
jgi:hypothetical protein